MSVPGAPRRPAAGVAVAVLGVVAIAVGAGLALRWLPKAGLSVPGVLGVVLLALGLWGVGAAGVGFWRHVHGVRRLWLLPAALLALVVLYAVGLAVSLTVVPPTAAPAGSEAAAQRLGAQVLRFPAEDGVRLSGWWVPSRNGAAVVLLHGSGETRAATLPQARVLVRHGYGVLLVDARGHGDSGGRGMDAGWYGDSDVRGAVDAVVARDGVDPARVAVLGLSMGGEEAVGAAAADDRIRAVVAEGATGRTAADKDAWLPDGPDGIAQRGLDALTYGVVDLLVAGGPPPPLADAVARAADTRFLVITAGSMPDEARAAAVLQRRAPGRVDVWTVPRGAHTHGLAAEPEAWEERVTGFLATALG